MNSEVLTQTEYEFFVEKNHMVVPSLLEMYYELKEYELVYYFCETFETDFEISGFYKMMALMEMSHYELAYALFHKHSDDWFDVLHQHRCYWKHILLFSLYFRKMELPNHCIHIVNQYYDNALVRLYDFLSDGYKIEDIGEFSPLLEDYPVIEYVWSNKYETRDSRLLNQWISRQNYNASLSGECKLNIANVYGNGIKIYSYKHTVVAASMHIITDGLSTVILDCGCEIKQDIMEKIPVKEILDYLEISKIDAVFISHAHLDHYGSLNEIENTKIYMTDGTRQIIRFISPEISFRNVEVVYEFSLLNINGIEIRFIPNGHIVGSALIDINWKGEKRIVYTGDFTIENQNTVTGLNIKNVLEISNKKIDILITETTYGKKKNMLSLKQYEKMFMAICSKMLQYGKKIIIPCFAVGRAQEVALILSNYAEKNGLKILIDGLAIRLTEYYQISSGKSILSKNISVCNSELEISEKIKNNDIILASSGMMRPGSMSYRYIENVIRNDNICIVKVGFMHQYEHIFMSIQNRINKNIDFVDLSLSAHAGYNSLIRTIESLEPECVIYVHGSGIWVDY